MDVADILTYNDELAKYVEENPSESLPLVRGSCLFANTSTVHNKMLPWPFSSRSTPGDHGPHLAL